VLEAMNKINATEPRPMWQRKLKQWADQFGEADDLDKSVKEPDD